MKKLSIIIPVYNGGEQFERCLEAVQQSTWLDWELIVVDDGSCDKTADIAAGYPDVCLICQPVNRGYGAALKTGFSAAQGNLLGFLDADGTYLGKYRKTHIPQVQGFWEKFYFRPGNLGYPVFDTAVGKVGVYICYDRHFPEGWRALGDIMIETIINYKPEYVIDKDGNRLTYRYDAGTKDFFRDLLGQPVPAPAGRTRRSARGPCALGRH